jgi:hypothetical protein
MKTDHIFVRMVAYVTGLVNQELLVQNEYLAAKTESSRVRLPTRVLLSNPEQGAHVNKASAKADKLAG